MRPANVEFALPDESFMELLALAKSRDFDLYWHGRSVGETACNVENPNRLTHVEHERLAAQADRPIDIIFTGLRPGEKMHEVLLGQAELDDRHAHPLISHCQVPPLSPLRLEVLGSDDADQLRQAVIDLCLVSPTDETVTL